MKKVLITGASRGIGLSMYTLFLESGYYCIGTSTSQTGVDKIERLLPDSSRGCGKVLNLADNQQFSEFIEGLDSNNLYPDILINNAGITKDGLFIKMNSEDWDRVININLNSLFRLTKACIKPMIKNRWGRVINISSVVALSGNPGQVNYSSAKSGVIGFTKSLALEVAKRNISVNAVAPGYIESDMTSGFSEEQVKNINKMIAMGRMGNPREVAELVYFLSQDSAGYITGETININGGLYCH